MLSSYYPQYVQPQVRALSKDALDPFGGDSEGTLGLVLLPLQVYEHLNDAGLQQWLRSMLGSPGSRASRHLQQLPDGQLVGRLHRLVEQHSGYNFDELSVA